MDRRSKMRVLNRLLDAGYADEKKVLGFGMKDMLVCEIRGEEIGIVLELQQAVKTHSVIAFLGAGEEETDENREGGTQHE